MGRTFSDGIVAVAIVLFAVAGCDDERDTEAERPSSPEVERSARAFEQQGDAEEESEELKLLRQAREFLDSGENARAVYVADKLLDSKDERILVGLVDIYGWVGKRALPQLETLMNKSYPEVSVPALDAWEMLIDELGSDFSKAQAVTNAVAGLSDSAVIDAVLMHIISIKPEYSLAALEGLILGECGKIASDRAKVMFEYVAGEPYSSPERTAWLMKERNDE